MKDVPEGGRASIDDQPVVMTNYVKYDVLGGNDREFDDHDDERFDDRNAHEELDMMIGDVEMTKYVTEDSLNIEQDNEGLKDEENVNL